MNAGTPDDMILTLAGEMRPVTISWAGAPKAEIHAGQKLRKVMVRHGSTRIGLYETTHSDSGTFRKATV